LLFSSEINGCPAAGVWTAFASTISRFLVFHLGVGPGRLNEED
jgi:hypothetical protein